MFICFSTLLALEPQGGGSLIDINPGLIVWTVVTFVILLFILSKTAWKPITAALSQRENAIRESLEKAETAKAEAQKILDQNQANLSQAEEESRKIVEQGRAYAEKLKDQIMQESRQQAQKLIADAAAEIERKKEAAFNELKGQISGIAIDAAERILKETVDKDKNQKIVNNYLSGISKN